MAKKDEERGKVLQSTQVGGYTLLNNEKLGRVMDLLEGLVKPKNPEEGQIVAKAKELGEQEAILALYARTEGAIKDGERLVSPSAFYDFAARKPREEVVKGDEDNYLDEMVRVVKKVKKGKKTENIATRIKRMEAKLKTKTKE